jgi:hypothetical protein
MSSQIPPVGRKKEGLSLPTSRRTSSSALIFSTVMKKVHHWNWLGNPVYHRVATPPAHSLAFIRATPKAPTGGRKYLVTAIMNCAMQLVDPVLVDTDQDDGQLLNLHGSELIRECGDRVFRFYSPHGKWLHDSCETAQDIVPDYGTAGRCQFEIGNGLYEDGPLISCEEWRQWRAEEIAAAEAPNGQPRKLSWTPSASLLKNCETITYPEPPPAPAPCETPTSGNAQSLLETVWTWIYGNAWFRVPLPYLGIMGTLARATWAIIRPSLSLFWL